MLLDRGVLTNFAGEQTFRARAAEIADHAHNTRGAVGDGVEFLRGLDDKERQREPSRRDQDAIKLIELAVFRVAHDSSKAMRAWMGELKKKPA